MHHFDVFQAADRQNEAFYSSLAGTSIEQVQRQILKVKASKCQVENKQNHTDDEDHLNRVLHIRIADIQHKIKQRSRHSRHGTSGITESQGHAH